MDRDTRNVNDILAEWEGNESSLLSEGYQQVAETILKQLGGGGRLKAMIGAKNFTSHPDGLGALSFQFPSPHRGPNRVKITLDPSDTYTMEFGKITSRGMKYQKTKEIEGVYNDQLRSIFEKETGLYLSLREERLYEAATAPPIISSDDEDAFDSKEGKFADPDIQQEVKRWKGYNVSMTYQVVSPESAEAGDFEDSGFEIEDEHYDYLHEIVSDSPIRNHSWVEWSSSPPDGKNDWIVSEGEPDYSSGNDTSYGLHIKRKDRRPLSKEEMRFLHKELRLLGRMP